MRHPLTEVFGPLWLIPLYLLMDGDAMEMRMQGECLHAELLADTKLQAVGKRKLPKGKHNAPGKLPGALCELL